MIRVKQLPKRSQVKPADRWDLASLFADLVGVVPLLSLGGALYLLAALIALIVLRTPKPAGNAAWVAGGELSVE